MPAENFSPNRFRRCLSVALKAFSASVLAVGIAGAAEAQSQDLDAGQSVTLRPGVVFVRDAGVVILMTDEPGIAAVEIGSGEILWREQVSAEPLIVDGRLLLAQIDRGSDLLEFATFDVAEGGKPIKQMRAEMPEGVAPAIDDGLGHRYRLRAAAFEGQIFVEWSDTLGGVAAVPRKVTKPEIRSGVLRVDLREGTVQPVADGIGARLFPDRPIGLSEEARMAGVEGPQFPSASGGYVLTSSQVADGRVWDKFEWTIWRRDLVEPIGKFRHFQPYAPFAVLPPVLLLEIPPHAQRLEGKLEEWALSIEAADLETGETLWTRPIRDTGYDGPVPH